MTLRSTNESQRSVRHRGAGIFVTLAAAAGLALIAPQPAAAADFAITTPDGTLFDSDTVTIEGTKALDSRIEIPSLTGGDPYCIEDGAVETYSCTFSLADGSHSVVVKEFPADAAQPTLEATVGVRVLGAPTVDGEDPLLTTGIITGTGLPGSVIRVAATGPDTVDTQCTTAQSSGFWSCPMAVSTSGEYTVTVQQLWTGTGEPGGSTTRTVTVDKDAPAIPVISQPTAGSRVTTQPATYAGTGENGARVDVFVDSVLICSGLVTGTAWSCTGTGVADGDRSVQAIQWDAAGNPSGATGSMRVAFGAAAVVPPPAAPETPADPDPEPAPDPAPAPTTPAPAPTPTPSETASPAPIAPFFPPPVGGASGLPPLDTWGLPTDYGAAIPAIGAAPWLLAVLLAVGFVVLFALPLRLLLSTLRTRLAPLVARLTPRDRSDEPPIFRPWTIAAIALAAAILLAALAGGIQAEARYLRLMVAIGIALVALNGLAIAVALKVTSRALGSSTGIRLVPAFLALAAVTALLSRTGGVQPPVIMGVVIAATFASGTSTRVRGVVSLVQLVAMTVLGLWAWLGDSALGPQEGLVPSLASETLSALCISAFGSVMLLLVPVGRMPGRAVFDWSWPAWLAVTLGAGTLTASVIVTSETFPLPWVVGGAIAFAVVSVATWSWIRYVEPQLVPRDA